MKKPLIIFGTGKIAEVVSYYATEECGFNVVAFAVDALHKKSDSFLGKPVVPLDELATRYNPDSHDAFVAVGYHDLNNVRTKKCAELKNLGFTLVSVVSRKSALPHNVTYGVNCFIMPPCIVHPCVKLGDNVFVWSGAMIGHHSVIENNCWLTSNCNIGGNVTMGVNCFVALNATVGHSVKVGNYCFLGANTLVTKDLETEKVVISESSKPIKLSSSQFLKFSSFSSL